MSNVKNFVITRLRKVLESAKGLDDWESILEEASSLLRNKEFSGIKLLLHNIENEADNIEGKEINSLKKFIESYESEDLINEQGEEVEETGIDEGVRYALEARMSNTSSDKIVSKIGEPANQDNLQELTESIFHNHNKLCFFISPQKEMTGQITIELSSKKDIFNLVEVYEKDNEYVFRHFGQSKPGKKPPVQKLRGGFYSYIFLSNNDEKFVLLSDEQLNPQRCTVKGTHFKLNDSKTIGDNRKIGTTQNVLFAHEINPAVQVLDDKELKEVKDKYDHEVMAEKLFGGFRHPEWFEKMIMAQLFVKEENDWPSGLLWIGPPHTGKSKMLEAIHGALAEPKSIMTGSSSTMKALTPSFSQRPPEPGYLIETTRLACVDEMLNILKSEKDQNDNFRDLLDLLEHSEKLFKSGKGSVRGKMDSTLIATGNPSYGFQNVVEMADVVDKAFLRRVIIYHQLQSHIDFIQERVHEVRGSIGGEKSQMPDVDDEFISFIDTMQEKVLLSDQLDYEKIKTIHNDLKEFVPTEMIEPYRGYTRHLENITIGLAKYNSVVNDRGRFVIKDKDYEEVKELFGVIISSWNENIDLSNLKPEIRVHYLSTAERKVFKIVEKNIKIKEEDVDSLKTDLESDILVEALLMKDILKKVTLEGEDYIVPYWYSYGE